MVTHENSSPPPASLFASILGGLWWGGRLASVLGMRTRVAAWLPIIPLLFACGGPAAPAEGPEGPAGDLPVEKPPGGAEEADAAPDKVDAPSGGDKPAAASAPASDEEVTAILQLVINDPDLDQYLHLGEPGRFPLQLSGERLPSGLKLVKSTEPVKIVDAPKSKKDAVLVITEIDVQGDKASVRYRYDIEGIRGNVSLTKKAHGWELKNSRLVEH